MKNIKDYLYNISDFIAVKAVDTANYVLDTLQQYPVSKGLLPSGAVAAPAFISADTVEYGLKITLLCLSIIGAGLTAYAKFLHVKKLKKEN